MEMTAAENARRDAWALWLQMREGAADVARQEIDAEMELIAARDRVQAEEMERYAAMRRKADAEEREMLANAMDKSQAMDDETHGLRQTLENTRRRQQEQAVARQKAMQK
jgi:hypothetical protein